MDHNLSAQVATEVDQCFDIILSFVADGFVRVCEIKPRWAGEQPVQTNDFHAGFFRGFANVTALFGRDLRDAFRECKRRDFHAVTTDFRCVVEDVFDFPIFEKFIAYCEFHDAVLSGRVLDTR